MSNDRYLVKDFIGQKAPAISAELNALAQDGWRLMDVRGLFHYFEREPALECCEVTPEELYGEWIQSPLFDPPKKLHKSKQGKKAKK